MYQCGHVTPCANIRSHYPDTLSSFWAISRWGKLVVPRSVDVLCSGRRRLRSCNRSPIHGTSKLPLNNESEWSRGEEVGWCLQLVVGFYEWTHALRLHLDTCDRDAIVMPHTDRKPDLIIGITETDVNAGWCGWWGKWKQVRVIRCVK